MLIYKNDPDDRSVVPSFGEARNIPPTHMVNSIKF